MSSTDATLRLPKLPELAKEDVEAVRSFLPGKLLGRTAALLSLVLLVLGFAVAVDQGLRQLLNTILPLTPWQRIALLVGLPALVIATQLLVEWNAGRVRHKLQRLVLQPAAVPEGYFRIGPYRDTAEDRLRFDRADRAHEKVLDWIKRSATTGMPLYLTGNSGSGKSSLLSAYVIPALRQEGWTVIEARTGQDPQTALHSALARLPALSAPPSKAAPAAREVIKPAVRQTGDRSLLLVLDQFEEFLILGKPEQQQRFVALVEDLRPASLGRLCLLLALRSDYQTLLDDLGLPPLRQGENYYQVGRFTIGAATRFMERSDLGLQPDALKQLLDSAAAMDQTPGLVRPITLNVLGYVLSTGQATAPALDAQRIVRLYIEQTVSQPGAQLGSPGP